MFYFYMAGSVGFWIIICIHVMSLVLAQNRDQFLHYDFSKADLHLDGMATIDDGGRLHLTNNTTKSTSHAFIKIPMKFTASTSFSTEFVFVMLPLQGDGQGMAFVVAPTTDLRYAGGATSDLGLFNKKNDNRTENHILAVELDTNDSSESLDKSGNHVGIDINSIVSVESAEASYFNDAEGKNITLKLAGGKSILIWIDYDGTEKLLNVTLAPVPSPKPVSSYLSRSIKPSVPLHDADQGMRQYVAEIASMGRLKHKNLVQLLGYWSERLNIIKGVASALLYLHEEWEQVVLHRDIKASNILLDAKLNGKLGDFGLARFHDRSQNLEATRVVGTIGYMAPELTSMGVATTKTDVYAFGTFILEVVCGRRPVDPDRPSEQMILLKWVATCGKKDTLMETVDSKLGVFGPDDIDEAKLLLKIGMICSESNPENRPSMRQIIQYLEKNVNVPNISFDTAEFGMANISSETLTQLTTSSSTANFFYEDVTILHDGR